MKPRLAAVIGAMALAISSGVWSAPDSPPATPDSMAQFRQEMRTNKRALVEKNLRLTPAEAKRFWPIYDRYQQELGPILQRQNRALLEYIQAGPTLSDAHARQLGKEMLHVDAEEVRLRDRQFKKLLGVLPATKAVRYIQLEDRMHTTVRYDIAQQMPLVQ
jgi:Spy/CpxP family protein refolding chaperone